MSRNEGSSYFKFGLIIIDKVSCYLFLNAFDTSFLFHNYYSKFFFLLFQIYFDFYANIGDFPLLL